MQHVVKANKEALQNWRTSGDEVDNEVNKKPSKQQRLSLPQQKI